MNEKNPKPSPNLSSHQICRNIGESNLLAKEFVIYGRLSIIAHRPNLRPNMAFRFGLLVISKVVITRQVQNYYIN